MLRTYWYDTVDPFRELTSLQQWMDSSTDAKLICPDSPGRLQHSAEGRSLRTGDQVAIKIEVPGLSEKDFEITLHNSAR